MRNSQLFTSVPPTIGLAIWATAFMQGRETLERSVDSLSDSPRFVQTLLGEESLAIHISNLRREGASGLRAHFPITGNTDGIIGSDEFVDFALSLGSVITTKNGTPKGLHEGQSHWMSTIRHKQPVDIKYSWQDMDSQLSNLLHETSEDLEAFDLVSNDLKARDILIDLEHDISIQHYPDDQPTRVTFLIGRLLRVLATTELAIEKNVNTFSATKQSMWSLPIVDLNRSCRNGLSAVVNYALNKT